MSYDATPPQLGNPTDISWNSSKTSGLVQYGDDRNVTVIFSREPVFNEAKSREAGRPIYEERDFVTAFQPGERLQVPKFPVTDEHKRRWPRQWAAYIQNRPQESDGTPIDLLFAANISRCAMYKAYGVTTVEQLVNLSGNAIDTIGMGCQDDINRARTFLERAKAGVPLHRYEGKIAELESENRTLKESLSRMQAQVNQLLTMIPHEAAKVPSYTGEGVQTIAGAPGATIRTGEAHAGRVDPGVFKLPDGELRRDPVDVQSQIIKGTHPSREVRQPVRGKARKAR